MGLTKKYLLKKRERQKPEHKHALIYLHIQVVILPKLV